MFFHVIFHTYPAYQFLTQHQHLKPALQRTHMAFAIFTGIQQARITHRRAVRSAPRSTHCKLTWDARKLFRRLK